MAEMTDVMTGEMTGGMTGVMTGRKMTGREMTGEMKGAEMSAVVMTTEREMIEVMTGEVTDLEMTGEMTGEKFVRRFREISPQDHSVITCHQDVIDVVTTRKEKHSL